MIIMNENEQLVGVDSWSPKLLDILQISRQLEKVEADC